MSPFAQVEFLYLGTVVICGLILLFLFSEKSRRTKLSLLVSEKLLPKLIPEWSPFQQKIKFAFMLLCFAMIFIALSRPQWGTRQRTSEPTGIDILVAIDVSKSMLARDVRPNRLERVKLSMTNLMEKVRGDRLGLIAFSGSAFLQCPLTLDHQAFVKTLEDLTIGLIKNPGTNLSKPIDEASRSFSQDDSDRFLILLSDGEDLEGEGLKRAKQAVKEGIRIFTIGIGSKEGDRIPLDPIGQPAQNFLTNPQGETIVSQKDENSLRAIAEATGGVYFPLGPTGEGLERTLQRLQSIGQQKKRELLSSELPIERFFPFALLALILLFIEDLTPSGRKKITRWGTTCLTLAIILLVGCLKRDNVKNAEDALRDGNPRKAALFYDAEINATRRMDKPIDPKLFLNAGLAHLEAGSLTEANQFLERSLDASVDDPNLQSIGLNALGNLFYRKTNLWLDEQNVGEARRSWEKALKFYDAAFQLDGNEKASANLASLKQQIEKRIQSLVSKVTGKIWRDLNGDGNSQKNEPGLKGFVFWDKDGNGEHNSSNEPSVQTNEDGFFAFEWISSKYPVSLELDSKIEDSNGSTTVRLMPMFPAPPPPVNPNVVKNHLVKIESPGEKLLAIPYRAAPLLIGQVWGDKNGNGIRESTESGFKNATLYLDQNGNFAMDENETTFKPQEDGSFAQPVPPGQYSVCVLPDNPDANVTFPLDARKSYLTWTNFESSSEQLDFGIQDDSEENEQSNAPDKKTRMVLPSHPTLPIAKTIRPLKNENPCLRKSTHSTKDSCRKWNRKANHWIQIFAKSKQRQVGETTDLFLMPYPLQTFPHYLRWLMLLTLFIQWNSITCHGQNREIRIDSSFQPASITLSNLSVYKIVIHGTQENPQGSIPSVPGLNLSGNPQTFRSASFINGVPSVRLELSFQAKPDRQGNFRIPNWNLSIGGKSHQVPAATLQVLAPNQQDLLKQQEQKQQEADLRQAAFIEFVNPREFLFLGETVAAEIRLFLWDRLPVTRVERPPLKTGDAFSITELDQPTEQRNVIRSNKTYSVFTWTVGLTAAMTGNQSLSFDTNIRVRTKNQRGSPFNNPFFNDPFFGFGRDESIKVTSEKNWIEVRSPPKDQRPPHFQGAIGSFLTESSIDKERVSLGDPIRLTFTLRGNGNFAAIPAPAIAPSTDFKVGPPSFSFSGSERTKHQGEQSFEYVITPLKAGILEIPEVLFSYFDPSKEQYFSTSTQSHTVRVDPGEKWIDPSKAPQEEASEEPLIPITDLFQTESEPGEWVLHLDPSISLSPWFYWGAQTIPLSAFVTLLILGSKRRNKKRDNLRQKENQFARKMKESLSHKDTELFFRSFKGLVRMKVGKMSKHRNPSSLSSRELLSLIKKESNSSSFIENLEDLLQKCDDLEFAKGDTTQVSLQENYQEAIRILKKIK